MKLQQVKDDIEYQGVESTQTFSIKASVQAFEILSSGLYSDKILAIVRELSCNAQDSHVLNKNTDVPFEIKLPNMLDPTFYVKDFGPGLSHEDVMSLYTTYFDSTKSDSNDFIGALGLGSKSPFSYVSTFNVESRFNGVKTHYICFKNEIGVPSVSVAHQEETDEPTGMTISLSTKQDDYYKWEVAAKKALMYFPICPTIVGCKHFAPYEVKHTVRGTHWKTRVSGYLAEMTGPYVVQGCVAYPINAGILRSQPNVSDTIKVLLDMSIDLTVPLGDIEVAASREALSYTPRTIKNLLRELDKAALELRVSIQQGFDDCKTEWEMCAVVDSLTNGPTQFCKIFENFHIDDPFIWNGKSVTNSLSIDFRSINVNNFIIKRYSVHLTGLTITNTWDTSDPSLTILNPLITKNLHVITCKIATPRNIDIKNHVRTLPVDEYDNKTYSNRYVLIIRPKSKKTYDQAELDRLIAALNPPSLFLYEDIATTKTVNSVTKRKTKEQKFRWTGFVTKIDRWGDKKGLHRRFGGLCWRTETIDLEEGGFYVPIEYYDIINPNIDTLYFHEIYQSAQILKFLPQDADVYGFKQKEISSLNDKWINVYDHMKQEYTKLKTSGVLDSIVNIKAVTTHMNNKIFTTILNNWSTIGKTINDGEMKTFLTNVSGLLQTDPDIDLKSLEVFETYMRYKITVEKQSVKLISQWNKLIHEAYPMLSMLQAYEGESKRQMVMDYINLVDRKCPQN